MILVCFRLNMGIKMILPAHLVRLLVHCACYHNQNKGQKDIADLASVYIEHLAYIIIAFAEALKSYVIKAANAAIVKTRTRNTYITIDRKLLIIIDILFEYVICIQSCSFITLIIENIAFMQRFHLMYIVGVYYCVFAWKRTRNTYLRIIVASNKIVMFRVNILSLFIICSVIMAMAFADILLKNSWQY